jgi:hypothetical protein
MPELLALVCWFLCGSPVPAELALGIVEDARGTIIHHDKLFVLAVNIAPEERATIDHINVNIYDYIYGEFLDPIRIDARDKGARIELDRDGLYWVYFQIVNTDGKKVPEDEELDELWLSPTLKVLVDSERRLLRKAH